MNGDAGLWLWRHPRADGAAGRCIGRTDLPVDRRRAKRLAHRVRAAARRAGLPREVFTSPLRRSHAVGRLLRGFGFVHRVDPRLAELDFGAWDGRPWASIAAADFAGWDADFLHHAPGGGETVAALRARVAAFVADRAGRTTLVVAHAGWVSALRSLADPAPSAARWPPALRHGALLRVGDGEGFSPSRCRSTAGPAAAGGTTPRANGSPRAA